MRTTLILAGALLTLTTASADLSLAREGKPEATIVVVGEAPEALEAGQALQSFLGQMSGGAFALANEIPKAPSGGLVVVASVADVAAVGAVREVTALAAQVRDDGFALFCDGKSRLIIAARKPTAASTRPTRPPPSARSPSC